MEEFYEGRRKREEGRILRCKMVEGRRKSILELPSLYFLFLNHPIPDLSSCIYAPTLLQALRNRKMEEGRSKMEDVIFHRNLRLSSCTLSPISSPTLHSPRICFGIVYHRGNRCDVRGLSSTRILLLLSMQ